MLINSKLLAQTSQKIIASTDVLSSADLTTSSYLMSFSSPLSSMSPRSSSSSPSITSAEHSIAYGYDETLIENLLQTNYEVKYYRL